MTTDDKQKCEKKINTFLQKTIRNIYRVPIGKSLLSLELHMRSTGKPDDQIENKQKTNKK